MILAPEGGSYIEDLPVFHRPPPRWPQQALQGSQEAPKMDLRAPQEAQKRAPRGTQEAPERHQRAQR
eukprot:5788089-Pyramimonas_sp.AAC.1